MEREFGPATSCNTFGCSSPWKYAYDVRRPRCGTKHYSRYDINKLNSDYSDLCAVKLQGSTELKWIIVWNDVFSLPPQTFEQIPSEM